MSKPKTMKVHLLSAAVRARYQVNPEEAVEIPEGEAKRLIGAGAARPAKKAKRTATRKPRAEHATGTGQEPAE